MTFFAGANNFTINYGRDETGPIFRHGDYIYHSSSTYSNESRVRVRRHDTSSWTRTTMYDHTEQDEYYDRDVDTPHWINTQHNGSPATSPNTQAHLSRISDYNRQYSRDREHYNQRREEYRQERERHRLEMERHRLEMERHRLDMERHRSERSYAQRENLHNFSINGGVFTVVNNVRSFGQSSFTNRNNHSNSFRVHQHQEPLHSHYHSHPDNYVEEDIDHLPPGMFEQNPRRDPEVLYESPAPSYNERFSDPVLESGPDTSEFVEADSPALEVGGNIDNGEFSDSADVPLYTKNDMFPVSAYTEAGSSL
ncbi:hypothetical protein DFH05DRAFT_1521362 [Lentinula detonsa]|uniref:Uncharacterized protein n=1 Tax=Lentinula detonsa TaxID=2804962 RepID=A0A9W8U015_9AGAR|nr:hypothetical protein DFH05DRAFT_1521362 [Lentinula detonsa]